LSALLTLIVILIFERLVLILLSDSKAKAALFSAALICRSIDRQQNDRQQNDRQKNDRQKNKCGSDQPSEPHCSWISRPAFSPLRSGEMTVLVRQRSLGVPHLPVLAADA
jgi:hypothetical protein